MSTPAAASGGRSGPDGQLRPGAALLPPLLLVLLLLLWLWTRGRGRRGAGAGPPGPWAWPVVGNALQLGPLPHLAFGRLARRYGDVFQLRLGGRAVVVLNGERAIRQALVRLGAQFAGRPDFPSFRLVSGGRSLAFGPYGERWRAQRRLAHAALRVFSAGGGRRLLERHVAAEARELAAELLRRGAAGARFDPSAALGLASANVICALCFGRRYGPDDAEFRALLGRNDRFGQTVGAGSLVDALPWLQAFPNPVRSVFRDFQALTREVHAFVADKVAQHRRSYDPRRPPRHISDAVLAGAERAPSRLDHAYAEATMSDIFGAGQDTTATALCWVVLLLLRHLPLQRRLQAELDRVVGRARLPTADDRAALPQLEAFLCEALRYSSFVPVTIPHATTADVQLDGFYIPRGTVVFINQWSVNYDPAKWKDPHVFDPGRFLDAEQRLDRDRAAGVMIFSLGKRRCIGDQLAKLQLFLFTAILLHQCAFEPNPAECLTMDCVHGLALKPQPFTVSVRPRGEPEGAL